MIWTSSLSLPAPSETLVSVKHPAGILRPAGPVIQTKSSDWLFPMSETSAPAGRRYSLLICTRFHGSGAAHSSFYRGGLQSGTNGITYASGNSCGMQLPTARHSTHPPLWASTTPAYCKLKEHNWSSGESSQVTLIKACGLESFNSEYWFIRNSFVFPAGTGSMGTIE